MNDPETWVPLWVKSNFTFLTGASHPHELAERAASLGLPALALTDQDSLAGVVQAHVALRAWTAGATPAAGAQVTLTGGQAAVLLPQSRRGYADLSTLITAGRLASPKGESRVTVEQLCSLGSELIFLWVAPYLRTENGELHDESFQLLPPACADAFRGRIYLGVARHGREGEKQIERLIASESVRYGIPQVAAPEVIYHDPARRRLQDVLTCIRNGIPIDSAGTRLRPNALHGLSDLRTIAQFYADRPDLLARTVEIARRCTFSLDEISYRYPRLPGSGRKSDSAFLREKTFQGARLRYPEGIPDAVSLQIERELETIADLKYDGYFLTMWEIVRFCREHGILCQGRGSAANSVVCYCLGVTAIDPVRMDLLFERFLSRERAEPPDIDLDIEHNRREEVIQHVYTRYGRDHAAMVCNVVRYRRRSAVRDVGKVFGIQLSTLDRITKILSRRGSGIPEAVAEAGLDSESPTTSLFTELAGEIREFPRHLSIHPGGFLLGAEPVSHIVPVENATMPGRTVIQWDKYAVEDMNLFKVDLLGLGALTHLDYAFRLLHDHRGVQLSMASIPADCRRTFAMMQRGETVGVFQVESRAQMAMLPRLKPESFYDLVIEISIIRPGPISGGMVHPFLRRREGSEEITYPHPSLEPVLKRTLGIPLFQEQVMKLAVVAADYSPGEADQLRRDMAAWHWGGRMEQHRTRLIERMVAKGIEREFAEQVFEQIRGFGEYGFPESHAASFALIAYSTAWLREHYPAEFTCSLLNAWPMGFYSPATIVGEARRRGLEIRPVDILESEWECTLEAAPGAFGDYAIRMGLRFVAQLGRTEWEKIESVRKKGGFPDSDIEVFMKELDLREDALRSLAQAGAFRSFGTQRRPALWKALGFRERREKSAIEDEDDTVFASLRSFESVVWDYRSLGHSTSAHPIESFRPFLRAEGFPSAEEVKALRHNSMIRYVGMVICRQRPDTAAGTVFLTLEDETGFVNLIVWPDRFERLRTVLLTGSFLGVSGKLQVEQTVIHIVVESAWHPDLASNAAGLPSRDFH